MLLSASVKEDERGGQVKLLQAYCISLPRDTVLRTCTVFTWSFFNFMFDFICDGWQNQAMCLHQVLRETL
jgi:hypothetical protein